MYCCIATYQAENAILRSCQPSVGRACNNSCSAGIGVLYACRTAPYVAVWTHPPSPTSATPAAWCRRCTNRHCLRRFPPLNRGCSMYVKNPLRKQYHSTSIAKPASISNHVMACCMETMNATHSSSGMVALECWLLATARIQCVHRRITANDGQYCYCNDCYCYVLQHNRYGPCTPAPHAFFFSLDLLERCTYVEPNCYEVLAAFVRMTSRTA